MEPSTGRGVILGHSLQAGRRFIVFFSCIGTFAILGEDKSLMSLISNRIDHMED